MGASAQMNISQKAADQPLPAALRSTGRAGKFWLPGAALAALIAPHLAAAQSVPPLPTREELQQPAVPTAPPRREQIVSAADAEVERAPCPLANPEYANIRFTLRGVEFSGTTDLDHGLLTASWHNMQGQEISLAAVCDIRDRAATALRAKGYLAAVQVPPQTISDGIVRFDILAAQLSRIEVRGDAGANAGLLQRYLAHLQNQPIFNLIDAERYLLLARDIPGMDARLTLRPGAQAGEVIGEVQVARMPYHFDFGLQNYGTRDVGRWSGVARAQLAGITGMGDLTTLSLYATPDLEEQKVVQIAHEFRVGNEGLRLGGSYSYAWTRPDIQGLDLRSDAQIISLYATYPLHLSQSRRVTLGGGLDMINQDIALGTLPLNRDRLRVIHMRAEAGWVDPASTTGRGGYSPAEPRWTVQTSLEARRGLSALGASKSCDGNGACFGPGQTPTSRIEGKADAFLLRGAAQGEFRPHPRFTLAATARGQWAADPLLSYEEFSGGNFTIGRGYDAGTIIGDSGIGMTLEARHASSLRIGAKRIGLNPFVFFDAAKIWNKDQSFSGQDGQHLYSAGAGLRAGLSPLGRIDISYAVPLTRAGFLTERPDPRLLLSFSTYFGIRSR